MASNGTDLYFCGSFDLIDSIPVSGIAKLTDNIWSSICGNNSNSLNGSVRSQVLYNGDHLIGGGFYGANGTYTGRLVRFDGTNFHQYGPELNGTVTCMFVDGSDLYVGGAFTNFNGVACNSILKFDGISWSALGTGLNNSPTSITKFGNDIIVAGNFSTAGGVTVNRIAKWNGSSWSGLATGMNKLINSVEVFNGELYAGGEFTTAGGVNVMRIAKWNGSIWSAVGPGVGNSSCTTCSQDVEILKANGSHLYIGGEFATVGGNTNLKKLVKWDGSSYSAVGNGTLTARNIYAIEFENDTIYVGSDELLSYGNINMHGISKFNGTSWSGLGSGICLVNGNTVNSILIYENKLHCGGNFYQAGNKVASDFATYTFPQSLSTYYEDNDADGYGNINIDSLSGIPPIGYVLNSDDCDDNDPDVYQGSTTVKSNSVNNMWSDPNHWLCDIPNSGTDTIIILTNTIFDIVSATLPSSLIVANDTLTIPAGNTLTLGSISSPVNVVVQSGGTLHVDLGGTLIVYGALHQAQGLVLNEGNIEVR